VSARPVLIALEYEVGDEQGYEQFDAAVAALREVISTLPPLAQPFNVTFYAGDAADRVARTLFERDCLPPGQTVEGRSGEAP
jgi:hypothetical protein